MKIKNNLENKINSLTKVQFDYLNSEIHSLIDEIKIVTHKSGLFKKSFKENSKKWEEQRGNKDFFIQIVEDDHGYYGENRFEIIISRENDLVRFCIEGIRYQFGFVEKSFFSEKFVFRDTYPDGVINYYPLRNNKIRDTWIYGRNSDPIPLSKGEISRSTLSEDFGYNDLIKFLKNQNPNLIRILLSSKHLKLIKSINQTIFNYLDKIESKIQEEKNQKIKVKSNVKDLISKEFDKNSDGELDIIQGDNLLIDVLEKNESIIVDFDHTIIQKTIRLNKYLSLKKKNLQEIFEIFKKIDTDKDLKSILPIFNRSIEIYQLLIIHSLNMIVSLKKKELVIYYEIYEFFDELGVFNSNWENEVSEKLSSIDLKLNSVISSIENLMYSIETMENRITTSLDNLTYVTKSSYQSLQSSVTSELKSIRKGVGLNNLLTGINTFQLNQINKQTKGLIG